MRRTNITALAAVAAIAAITLAPSTARAQARDKCELAWSHYVTWEGVQYMKDSGILAKWNRKYSTEVSITHPMKYTSSIEQFAAGQFCALAVTNMDALTGPATGGIPTRFIVVQDTSHGNDGMACKSSTPVTLKDLKGRKVYLVEGTVSHYALARWLQSVDLKLSDVRVEGVDDENKIVGVFEGAPKESCVVTWKPFLDDILLQRGVKPVANSSQVIPYEIIDGIVVNDKLASENVRKVIVGAWFEVTAIMAERGSLRQRRAIELMARSAGSGVTAAAFNAQLATTNLFYQPRAAIDFIKAPARKDTMRMIRDFSFQNGFMTGVKKVDEVGIQFPDTPPLGDAGNVKLFFDPSYMQKAADGQL